MDKGKMLILGLVGLLILALVSVSGCIPTTDETSGGFDWTLIVFLVVIFALFYFVLIRPQRKRQKEHQQMVQELKRGDKVITAGGIHGIIESVNEDNVVVKVESGTTIRVAKGSVALKQEPQ
ncbi:preprotein translocase subunit YajC [Chloroflexota bacterium]